nr:hypothetical protein BaRGS_020433 [Batillaria attramentaria]
MVDHPFKYTIHFPDPDSPREEDDEKHLAKYSPMYEKKGFITLQVMVPAKTLFFQAHKVVDVARGLMGVLSKQGVADNPIILHIFSNGGTMVYSHLSTLLNSPDSGFYQALSVRGVIFDSAPGKSRVLNAVKAFMGTIQTNWILRYILGFCLLVYMFITRFLLTLLPCGVKAGKGFQLYDSICEDPTKCPQLFLYSKADRVIMAEDVEEVVTRRKEKGVDVKSLCWEDSPHVAHFRAHPEVYAKACLDFISSSLELHANGNKEGVSAL